MEFRLLSSVSGLWNRDSPFFPRELRNFLSGITGLHFSLLKDRIKRESNFVRENNIYHSENQGDRG